MITLPLVGDSTSVLLRSVMKPGTSDLQLYKQCKTSQPSQSQTAHINFSRRLLGPKFWDFLMGICVSTKNTMKVRDIPKNSDIVVSTIELQDLEENQCDLNKISVYKSPDKNSYAKRTMNESVQDKKCRGLDLSPKSDIDSIQSEYDQHQHAPKTSLQTNVQNDYYSEISDDSDNQSVLDEGDYLWIPNTLACHMGLHRQSRFIQV